jgi:hypothetical protein
MDEVVSTYRLSAKQGGPRVYQRREGCYVVAHDEDGLTHVNKLTLVPRKTDLDRFEDALSSARDALEYAVRSAVGSVIASASHEALEDAFARYDFNTFHALQALREALKP